MVIMKALSKRTIVLTVAVIILAVLITSFLFVWDSKPVIGYYISGYAYTTGIWDFNSYGPIYTSTMPNTYTYVNSNTPLIVALNWQNTGKADVSLKLVLATQNANITWFSNYGSDNTTIPTWGSESDGQTYNGTMLTLLSETKGPSTMQNRYIDILPIGIPQNFTITFSIKDNADIFASLTPNGTTTATYELTHDNIYQLVT
jgi:hypothetical protein